MDELISYVDPQTGIATEYVMENPSQAELASTLDWIRASGLVVTGGVLATTGWAGVGLATGGVGSSLALGGTEVFDRVGNSIDYAITQSAQDLTNAEIRDGFDSPSVPTDFAPSDQFYYFDPVPQPSVALLNLYASLGDPTTAWASGQVFEPIPVAPPSFGDMDFGPPPVETVYYGNGNLYNQYDTPLGGYSFTGGTPYLDAGLGLNNSGWVDTVWYA